MKTTLLLAAAFLAVATITTSAGKPLHSPRGKESQTKFVRAEARVLGGRGDRSRILAPPRHADQMASARKVQTPGKATPTAHRGMIIGGRNSPK